MAKILVAGDAVIITSSRKLEEIKELEKYNPKALFLYEEDDDGKLQKVFRAGSTSGTGVISKSGVFFAGEARDGSGLATITAQIPDGIEDAKAWVADEFGYAVVQLNKVEAGIDAALAKVAADKAAIEANIEIR